MRDEVKEGAGNYKEGYKKKSDPHEKRVRQEREKETKKVRERGKGSREWYKKAGDRQI